MVECRERKAEGGAIVYQYHITQDGDIRRPRARDAEDEGEGDWGNVPHVRTGDVPFLVTRVDGELENGRS